MSTLLSPIAPAFKGIINFFNSLHTRRFIKCFYLHQHEKGMVLLELVLLDSWLLSESTVMPGNENDKHRNSLSKVNTTLKFISPFYPQTLYTQKFVFVLTDKIHINIDSRIGKETMAGA